MKLVVHIRQAVEVEVPDALVPSRRDRWSNHAMQRYAMDAALAQIERGAWHQETPIYGGTYWRHPALGWIEYPKKEITSGVI